MKSGFLLDIVVTQSTSILKLLSSKNKTLLIRRNSFLILNLSLDVVDSVRRFDIKSDGLTSKGLYKNLHTSTKTQYQMKSGFLLDVVVTQSTSVLKLLSSKNKTLLIRRNSFLVLDLGLDVVDSVRRFYIKSDGLSSKSLYENLHTSTKTQYQMKSGFSGYPC